MATVAFPPPPAAYYLINRKKRARWHKYKLARGDRVYVPALEPPRLLLFLEEEYHPAVLRVIVKGAATDLKVYVTITQQR